MPHVIHRFLPRKILHINYMWFITCSVALLLFSPDHTYRPIANSKFIINLFQYKLCKDVTGSFIFIIINSSNSYIYTTKKKRIYFLCSTISVPTSLSRRVWGVCIWNANISKKHRREHIAPLTANIRSYIRLSFASWERFECPESNFTQ